jgi:hypothetical protein
MLTKDQVELRTDLARVVFGELFEVRRAVRVNVSIILNGRGSRTSVVSIEGSITLPFQFAAKAVDWFFWACGVFFVNKSMFYRASLRDHRRSSDVTARHWRVIFERKIQCFQRVSSA